MAKFKITPTTTVAELKEQFRNEVGCVLRVYQGRSEAPDGATLVSLGAKEGELECRTSRTVGKFEEAFQNELNLKVKVYTKDNWVKVLDGITLAVAGQLPNGMTKAKMEEHLSYKRDEAESAEVVNEETSEEIDVNEDIEPLPNPNAIYFVINSEPREISEEDEECGEEWFVAYRAIKDCSYFYGVCRHNPNELADELGVSPEDIELFDMGYDYDCVENYPSGKNIYLPKWLYELYTSPDSNLAELCPDEDSEPIRAAIDCCLTDYSSDWVFDQEVPCMIVKSNGNTDRCWFAKNTK